MVTALKSIVSPPLLPFNTPPPLLMYTSDTINVSAAEVPVNVFML